jgi:hypothetical protein
LTAGFRWPQTWPTLMKLGARQILGVVFALATVAGSACGSSTPSSTSNSSPAASTSPAGGGKLDSQVAMPNGFPADVPIYPGARLTSAGSFTSNGTTTWGMEWETLDGVDTVQAFYTAKLAEGDWTLSFSGSSNGNFSAIFNRKSSSTVGGILGVDGSSGITKISLALTNGG